MPRRKRPVIADALLNQLPAGADPRTAFDPNGSLDALKKASAERPPNAEMDRHPTSESEAGNARIRDEGLVRDKAVHVALGVRGDETREVLGPRNEGAKFWFRVFNEIKNRGIEDILIAVVDGLNGFPDAIQAVFPETTVQTCIVHLIRTGLDVVSWKDRKSAAAALKDVCRADGTPGGGRKYPAIGPAWRRARTEVIPFSAVPAEVRRILYTTNAVEAPNAKLRRAARTRGHFPNDEAALKPPFPVLNRAEKEWTMPAREWRVAKARFAGLLGQRFIKAFA